MKYLVLTLVSFIVQNSFALEIGADAPAVTLTSISNGVESQVQIQAPLKEGQKVLLEFFQTNCSYCVENLPNVVEAEKEAGDKVLVRHVGIDRSEADLRKYATAHPSFNVVLDSQRLSKKAYEIRGTPTTYIISADGKIAYFHEGVWEDSEKVKIREILAK